MAIPSQGFMRCSKCGVTKPHSEMTSNSIQRSNRWKQCTECYRAYMVKYRGRNREAYNEYHREWRKKLGDKYREYMVGLRAKKIAAMTPEELAAFRRSEVKDTQRWHAALKDQVFAAYGGWECACCGETEPLFLSIDHVLNNGAEQRRNGDYARSSAQFYRWLKKNGFPDGYQVLCMNCNVGKHRNGGVCPHKQGVTTIPRGSRAKRPEVQSTQ